MTVIILFIFCGILLGMVGLVEWTNHQLIKLNRGLLKTNRQLLESNVKLLAANRALRNADNH